MLSYGTAGSSVCKCSHKGQPLLKNNNLMHKKSVYAFTEIAA